MSSGKGPQPRVLVLEDDKALTLALREYLEEEGWEVQTALTAAQARSRLAERNYDLVLADYLLPGENGLAVLEEVVSSSPLTKVMVMTGLKDMEVAAQAFRKGAADLIPKPFKLPQLAQRIDRLMEGKRTRVKNLPRRLESTSVQSSSEIVGSTPNMQKVFRLVDLVSNRNVTVLITGESGTGKELVARAIHNRSANGSSPFVAINCGAIPEQLLEDELFGHVRGAYTDARQARIGKFEAAEGGTMLLDEIGEMSFSLQVKLLRVLEERQFQKLGSNQSIRVNVRIVAATNSNLRQKVEKGEFRTDLFYRLNVVPIHLPALRDRREDIPALTEFMLDTISRESSAPRKATRQDVLERLMEYHFPGNVRELRNILELACVLSGGRDSLRTKDFPTLDHPVGLAGMNESLTPQVDLPQEGINLNQVVGELERNLICQSLKRTGGNKGKAARLLSLKRTTLVEKLRRMNLLEEFSR